MAWGLKAVVIAVAGGLDQSPLETPLFLLGLLSIVVSFASLGVALARGRPVALKVVGGVVGILIGGALSALASAVAAAAIPDSAGWVQEEAGLWLSALLAVAVAVSWHTRRRGLTRTAA